MQPRPVLRVEDLSVAAGSTSLLHEVTFAIDRGERVGLIGESGSGKSLTALAVMGLLPEGLGATGEVRLSARSSATRNLLEVGEREMARLRGPIGVIRSARDPKVLALSVLAEIVADDAARGAPAVTPIPRAR